MVWAAGLVLCALVAAGLWWWLGSRSVEVDVPPPAGGGLHQDHRDSQATALVARLDRALHAGSRGRAVALAAPTASSRELLAAWWANVHALHLTELSLRYVDDRAATTAGPTWAGEVEVDYRVRGYDPGPARLTTVMRFRDTQAGLTIAGTGRHGDRVPLWLQGRLDVARTDRSLVMRAHGASGYSLARLSSFARRAVTQVDRVLTGWHGRLVVEVPSDQPGLQRILDATPGKYDDTAAITTTVDGSLMSRSPVHVMVNPAVFDHMGTRAPQVVLTHETTHVATRAALSDMPLWLLEGFADYVALRHVPLPTSVTAGQILAQVRHHGPPGHLPDQQDFDPTGPTFGTSYESAWLANRYLARSYGQDALLDFYRAVDAGTSDTQAFRSVLHTTKPDFVAGWRRYLRRLAG